MRAFLSLLNSGAKLQLFFETTKLFDKYFHQNRKIFFI